MLVVTMIALWLTLLAAPETPIAKALRRALIDYPAARITATHVRAAIALTVALLLGLGLDWLIGGDFGRVIAFASPDALAWLASFEVSAYLDIAAAAVVAASTVRLRSVAGAVVALRRRLPRGARRRAPRTRADRPAARNDNDADRPAPARAA
ncbi:hypothetical protein EAH79_07315 [Sphingomonas koreensis]|nr:hypothetical protein EAH79_07315 [Sphingomonas koreensis]